MKPSEVVILGRSEDKQLTGIMAESGCSYVLCGNLKSAMGEFRKRSCNTVIVDYDHTSTDLLEFLLNVRDVVDDARVFVVSRKPKRVAEKLGVGVPWVMFVDPEELQHKLTLAVCLCGNAGCSMNVIGR